MTERQITSDKALKTGLRLQSKIRRLRGKLAWEGDLDAMRIDR